VALENVDGSVQMSMYTHLVDTPTYDWATDDWAIY